MKFILLLIALPVLAVAARMDSREAQTEVCFGRQNPKCFIVAPRKIAQRNRGRLTTLKALSKQQFDAAKKAIHEFIVSSNSGAGCPEPVEIADFVGDSLVRVQSFCATSTAVRALKRHL